MQQGGPLGMTFELCLDVSAERDDLEWLRSRVRDEFLDHGRGDTPSAEHLGNERVIGNDDAILSSCVRQLARLILPGDSGLVTAPRAVVPACNMNVDQFSPPLEQGRSKLTHPSILPFTNRRAFCGYCHTGPAVCL